MSGYPDYPPGPGPGSGGYTPYGGPQDYAATPQRYARALPRLLGRPHAVSSFKRKPSFAPPLTPSPTPTPTPYRSNFGMPGGGYGGPPMGGGYGGPPQQW